MTESSAPARAWDLEQYSTKARRERALAAAAAPSTGRAADQPAHEHIARKDDGDWLAPAERKTRPRYVASGSVFWPAFTGALLSVATLGLYRFWMLAKLRRAYAGSIRLDGDPVAYVGTGFEKLVGFLIAAGLLAGCLLLANLALAFAGLTATEGTPSFEPVSLVALAPVWFWAQYRRQRYLVSRLEWRSTRFSLAPGAFGYAWRSVIWAIVTVLTLGLAYPYMHFAQARYLAQRCRLGTLAVRQEGSWLGLMAHWLRLYLVVVLMFLAFWGLSEEMELDVEAMRGWLAILVPIGLVVTAYTAMVYRIAAFRCLWDYRTIGGMRIDNDLKIYRIVFAYIGGTLGVGVMAPVIGGIVGLSALLAAAVALGAASGALDPAMVRGALDAVREGDEPLPAALLARAPVLLPAALGLGLGGLAFLAAAYALAQSLVVQPILRRKAETMLLRNPDVLAQAGQA